MMILNCRRQWAGTILLLIPTVNLQMLYPMAPMPPPMYAYPPPPPPPAVAMAFPPSPPIAFQIVQIKTRKNATVPGTVEKNGNNGKNNKINGRSDDKTFEKTVGIAIPMAFPGPVQFAMPPPPAPLNLPAVIAASCMMTPRPTNCPVCPPCSCAPCTPSFYANCSECHKKCGCREKRNSVKRQKSMVVRRRKSRKSRNSPINKYRAPKKRRRPKSRKDDSSDSSDSSSGSSEWTSMEKYKRKKKAAHARVKSFRRKGDVEFGMSDNYFAKPVLSYITRDGVVEIEKPLNNDEAEELMNENDNNYYTNNNNNRNTNNDSKEKVIQKVQVITEEDADKKQRLKVISDIQNDYNMKKYSLLFSDKPQQRKEAIKPQSTQHILKEGKKEIIFKPPDDKRISNISVSFQIS